MQLALDLKLLKQQGWIQQTNDNALLEQGKGYMMHNIVQECLQKPLPIPKNQIEQSMETLWKIAHNAYRQNAITR